MYDIPKIAPGIPIRVHGACVTAKKVEETNLILVNVCFWHKADILVFLAYQQLGAKLIMSLQYNYMFEVTK